MSYSLLCHKGHCMALQHNIVYCLSFFCGGFICEGFFIVCLFCFLFFLEDKAVHASKAFTQSSVSRESSGVTEID